MPRFCGENAIAPRPIVTDPPVLVETHLAWRRTSINMAKRRFIEASQKVGAAYMTPLSPASPGSFDDQPRGNLQRWKTGPTARR